MANPKDLKFKPYVGLFFRFEERIRQRPSAAIIGRNVYGNSVEGRKKIKSINDLPETILVIDEKRNYVRFLNSDGDYYWTTKAQIEPIDLPTYDGNPIPILSEFRNFLVYCTDTKIRDFKIDEMTKRAMELLPKIDAMIDNQRMQIIPK